MTTSMPVAEAMNNSFNLVQMVMKYHSDRLFPYVVFFSATEGGAVHFWLEEQGLTRDDVTVTCGNDFRPRLSFRDEAMSVLFALTFPMVA